MSNFSASLIKALPPAAVTFLVSSMLQGRPSSAALLEAAASAAGLVLGGYVKPAASRNLYLVEEAAAQGALLFYVDSMYLGAPALSDSLVVTGASLATSYISANLKLVQGQTLNDYLLSKL